MTRQDNQQPEEFANEHAEMRERIEAYLMGGLIEADRKSFELHISSCPACAAALASARALAERLAILFAESSPSADFEERLVGRLRAERGPQSTTPTAPTRADLKNDGPQGRRVLTFMRLPRRVHPAIRNAGIATAATLAIAAVGWMATSSPQRSVRFVDLKPGTDRLGGTTVTWTLNPFAGTRESSGSRDNIFALNSTPSTAPSGAIPNDALDSTLLPTDDSEFGRPTSKSRQPGASAASGAGDKPAAPAVPELKVARTKTTVSVPEGGKLHLGGQTVRGELDAKMSEQTQSTYNFRPSELGINRTGHLQHHLDKKDEKSASFTNAPTTAVPGSLGDSDGRNEKAEREALTAQKASKDTSIADALKLDRNQEAEKLGREDADNRRVVAVFRNPIPADNANAADATSPASTQKIIRTGEMQFQVERFDAAVDQVAKIVTEEGGYVGTTDSDKLANGKVRGTVTIRVAPDRLDTVVLKLRGIGDLKSQKINAQDITRQYTDLESALRAARAMEDRLLEIIKTGKGEVKDLLEAEKQLGVWREKIEQLEGEIRYDNNQVALSTLVITLEEKDIRSPAYATTSEQVTMALETPDVEQAYAKARDAIIAAKGRITQSDLKQFDAGQFGATIGAELPPDQADALIGRLKQLDGRVANFTRATSVVSHAPDTGVDLNAPIDTARQQRDNVKLSLTMYNLANIAPRRTITLSIAAANVDEAYRKLLDSTSALTTRVVASNIDRPRPEQASANLTLQAPTDKAEALLATLRAMGEVVRMETTDNPDTQNVTEAKRGFQVQIFSLASATARHTEQLQLAVPDVPATFADLLSQLSGAEARVVSSQLNQQDRENINGSIEFETSRTQYEALRPTLLKAGDVVSRVVGAAQDTQNTVDSKIHVSLSLLSSATQPPRQTTTLGVEVNDVTRATGDWIAAAGQAGGRATGPTDVSHDRDGKAVAHVEVEVPLSQASAMIETARKLGALRALQTDVDARVSEGKLSRAKLNVTFANSAATLGGAQSTGEAVREAFGLSGAALRWCIKLLVVGLCFVAPIVLIIWMVWKLISALRGKRRATVAPIAA